MHSLMLIAQHSILAQRRGNRALNNWLSENPLILGGIFLLIGIALLGFGVYELSVGVAHNKRGKKFEGGTAKTMSIARLVAGVVCCGFAIYKMLGY